MSDAARNRDSVQHTLVVAVCLSLICSILVASTAVILKPIQERNEEAYRQKIIQDVAGLNSSAQPDADVQIVVRMVELATGRYVSSPEAADFDALAAANNPQTSVAIPSALDLAGIQRRALHAPVYVVERQAAVEQIILPVYGLGLWSTMYGYLALSADGQTVRGLRFYEHAETPGLGDQIDDPDWRMQWKGKKLFGADGLPRIEVIRGQVADDANWQQTDNPGDADQWSGATPTDPDRPSSYQVDGLSGATLTGRGVTLLLRYWTGPHGFGPFLEKLDQPVASIP